MVCVNIIFDFGSTQKWAKSDASLSVDAFGGVRDGDRIRASGDVLFFHIVKFTSVFDTYQCSSQCSGQKPALTAACSGGAEARGRGSGSAPPRIPHS